MKRLSLRCQPETLKTRLDEKEILILFFPFEFSSFFLNMEDTFTFHWVMEQNEEECRSSEVESENQRLFMSATSCEERKRRTSE